MANNLKNLFGILSTKSTKTAKINTKRGHLTFLPHSIFRVMVMVNPWRTLAFYFQSTLNCTVNDIPVLAAPRDFVKETL